MENPMNNNTDAKVFGPTEASVTDFAKSRDEYTILGEDVFNTIIYSLTPKEMVTNEAIFRQRASELGKKKDFEKILKTYREEAATAFAPPASVTCFLFAPLVLDCGEWVCIGTRIYKPIQKNGYEEKRLVCSNAILPTALIENIETEREKVRLEFLKNMRWRSIIVDREIISNKSKILTLANYGIDINSANSALMVDYFSDLINLNQGEKIKYYEAVSHLGWAGKRFVPYASELIFDGEEQNKALFSAVKSKGELAEWIDFVRPLRKNIYLRMQMAAAFASPLIERVGALPFVLHLWGGTGTGKTVGLMVAMSIWGNPSFGKLVRTMNMTNNAMMDTAALLNSLPFAGDELQTIKRQNQNYDSLIMQITEGVNRGRMKYDKQEAIKTWRCAFLFTGEEPCTDNRSGGGTKNRVLEIEATDKVVENGNATAEFVRRNYGAAGKEYIKFIEDKDISGIYNSYFNEIFSSCDTTEKQAASMALCMTGDRLASERFFPGEKPIEVNDILAFLTGKTEIDISERAYEFVLDLIAQNEKRFSDNQNGEIWGKINTERSEIYINKSVLTQAMSEQGYSFDAVKRKWAEKGYLKRSSQGKYYKQTHCYNIKANYVVLAIKQEIVDPSENTLPF